MRRGRGLPPGVGPPDHSPLGRPATPLAIKLTHQLCHFIVYTSTKRWVGGEVAARQRPGGSPQSGRQPQDGRCADLSGKVVSAAPPSSGNLRPFVGRGSQTVPCAAIRTFASSAGSPAFKRRKRHDPSVGRQELQVRTGPLKVNFTFASPSQGSFVVEQGGGLAPDGHTETVELDLKEIREGLYLNSWTEASGATVTHVEDFANATVYSNVTVDGTLYNFVGTIKEA
ncbi:MoaF-related domain-containing protein [Streptomyces griseus]|uniref:MoaF-related domain-containing protein n=1 Tax=Streptomyces griseus TaxID=1911 RepID=UPI00364A556E